MFRESPRQRSLSVYHLHMGGADGDALEFEALKARRFDARLRAMGVRFVDAAWDADIVVLTGLLLRSTLDYVLQKLSNIPQPSVLIAAGDCAINGGRWASAETPGLAPYPLSHYADIQISVPGDPVTAQALVASLVAAAERLRSRDENPADSQGE